MEMNQIQFLELTEAHKAECMRMSVASGSGWWRMGKSDIPSFIPEGLRPKLDGGVMVLSGSASGTTYLMYGAERVDAPADSIDIQPFGIAVFPAGAGPYMAVVHHGGWPDRSVPVPSDYWNVMSSCATGSYFQAHPPEGKTNGTLDELSHAQRGAFEIIFTALSVHAKAHGPEPDGAGEVE